MCPQVGGATDGFCRLLPVTCLQAAFTAQARWIQTLTPLTPSFWSILVQKSSNVSAVVLVSDANEIPSNI